MPDYVEDGGSGVVAKNLATTVLVAEASSAGAIVEPDGITADDVLSATPAGGRGRRRRGMFRRQFIAMLLLPSILLIGIFSYYPALRSLVGGFYQWNGFSTPTYAGVSQFREYVKSATFAPEARNLLLLVIGSILITLVSQFIAAEVVCHLPKKVGTVAKYLLTLPIVLPPIVLIDVWAYLLNPTDGLINKVFGTVGLPQPEWLTNNHLALVAILLVGFPWVSNLGFLIFLGGVQNLPREMTEASAVDGCGWFRRVFAMDIPMLMPQFRIVVVLSGVYAVQNFITILLLTNGGPGNATMVPALDMYQQAFQNSNYGMGMAIGTLLFVAMLIFTLVVMRALRPRTA
ncbi:MAG TPA: sugar ABC transporter permease [Acidimicrobiales bacterium]|nr:sugar ABC transporter permease [Acidimicrobiales bacterium]